MDARVMLDDKAFAAGFWALAGAAALKIASWIAQRFMVPRDDVTKRMLQDMASDIAVVRNTVTATESIVSELGQRVAKLEGRLNGRGR